MTTSAQAAASDTLITLKPAASAFAIEDEPSRRATATSGTPLSFKLAACACPCEP